MLLTLPRQVGTCLSFPNQLVSLTIPVQYEIVDLLDIETPKARISRSQATLEKEKRAKYAQQLFDELNEAVFKSALPKETKLSWNKRLLTTTGRAGWRKWAKCSQVAVDKSHFDTENKGVKMVRTLRKLNCRKRFWTVMVSLSCQNVGPLAYRGQKELGTRCHMRCAI